MKVKNYKYPYGKMINFRNSDFVSTNKTVILDNQLYKLNHNINDCIIDYYNTNVNKNNIIELRDSGFILINPTLKNQNFSIYLKCKPWIENVNSLYGTILSISPIRNYENSIISKTFAQEEDFDKQYFFNQNRTFQEKADYLTEKIYESINILNFEYYNGYDHYYRFYGDLQSNISNEYDYNNDFDHYFYYNQFEIPDYYDLFFNFYKESNNYYCTAYINIKTENEAYRKFINHQIINSEILKNNFYINIGRGCKLTTSWQQPNYQCYIDYMPLNIKQFIIYENTLSQNEIKNIMLQNEKETI